MRFLFDLLNKYVLANSVEKFKNVKMNRNIILFIEPPAKPFDTPEKIGNSYINRFTIDEDAAFELSGVYYLKIKNKQGLIFRYKVFRI